MFTFNLNFKQTSLKAFKSLYNPTGVSANRAKSSAKKTEFSCVLSGDNCIPGKFGGSISLIN